MRAIEVSQRGSSNVFDVKKSCWLRRDGVHMSIELVSHFISGLQLLIRPPMTDSLERM
jgi:hypothetical protein